MKIVTKTHGQVTVLVLSQKSCEWEPPAQPIYDAIAGIDKNSNARVLVDLRQVLYLGSVETGDLVRAYKRVIEAGGMMKLLLLQGSQAQKVIELTRLTKVFECYEDERTALESF